MQWCYTGINSYMLPSAMSSSMLALAISATASSMDSFSSGLAFVVEAEPLTCCVWAAALSVAPDFESAALASASSLSISACALAMF